MSLKVEKGVATTVDGQPADVFTYTVNEHINVGDYSYVETSATLTRWIEDSEEAREEVIAEVEKILELKREEVIDLIEKK